MVVQGVAEFGHCLGAGAPGSGCYDGGSVYFDVSKFEGFGSVSGYSEAEMLALAAERGGNRPAVVRFRPRPVEPR